MNRFCLPEPENGGLKNGERCYFVKKLEMKTVVGYQQFSGTQPMPIFKITVVTCQKKEKEKTKKKGRSEESKSVPGSCVFLS